MAKTRYIHILETKNWAYNLSTELRYITIKFTFSKLLYRYNTCMSCTKLCLHENVLCCTHLHTYTYYNNIGVLAKKDTHTHTRVHLFFTQFISKYCLVFPLYHKHSKPDFIIPKKTIGMEINLIVQLVIYRMVCLNKLIY